MKIKDTKTGEVIDGVILIVKEENGSYFESEKITNIERFGEIEVVDEELSFEEVVTANKYVQIGDGTHNNVIRIADRDYYEILPDGTKKTEFTWDEAMEIEKKTNGKWRVPTVPEWFAICTAFGRSEDGTDVDPQVLKKNLNLATDEDDYGYYWSAASYSTTNSYSLLFNSSSLNPRDNYNKGAGFAVRCVASSVQLPAPSRGRFRSGSVPQVSGI